MGSKELWNPIIVYSAVCSGCRERLELTNYSQLSIPRQGKVGPIKNMGHFIISAKNLGWRSLEDFDGNALTACPNCIFVKIRGRLEVITKKNYHRWVNGKAT